MATDPRRRRRPSFDPSLAWATLAVVAVAAIIGFAILLTRPSPVEAPDASGSAAATPDAAIPALPTTVDEATWWRVGWQDDGQPIAASNDLVVGTIANGVTASLELDDWQLSGPPYVRGPVHGQVLVATGAQAGTLLRIVDGASGDVRAIGEVKGVAIDAELMPDGGSVLYLAEDDAGLAAYALPTDGSGRVRQISRSVPRVARLPAVVLAARIPQLADLRLNDRADQLAILDCQATCTLRVVEIETGAEISFDLGEWDNVDAWEDDTIVLSSGRCIHVATATIGAPGCAGPEWMPATELQDLLAGVELPAGWSVRLLPGKQALQLVPVAVGRNGEEVVLDALGAFGGQG